ncbi:bifunctional 3-(3-hydroxy-phenyl)propionate/3-hydroxycinnamic acid hydroxylase [Nocardioides eburneiflavus]|uniref:Bifunctional 3-(3-hydroxy-phenyl)propionate/3-hydroxycinnamic acid hydroxylase n=1 Tax=Nocardioides eburneiflavus TaxID=2518372 RepID=A0A4Z1CL46_9ACTN|nr:bifunctional 3-(3-hydroxy-phenyl)propionate/3-hydroxycinnamic acid hydroxylase [Nocardioides eburneiflavus]TGN65360.1 bifunctional 3-(3-hydroxy-phenyl)propionate/3-hydroxycinnamic acid hydroxylase [Nocardioides eburneiflavus]
MTVLLRAQAAAAGGQWPVVVVGAGPSGVTAATLLAQYGVRCLLLDRWNGVYPQPRAVHLDDEVYRILDRLGVAKQFSAISRPSEGLRLLDRQHEVLAEFRRSHADGVHGYPQANMFDQPELEQLLRDELERHSAVTLLGDAEVTEVSQDGHGRVRVDFTDRRTGAHESVLATYVLGCDGANSVVRSSIHARMRDLRFEQRWLVVDIATDVDLDQWEGVHQVCDPRRAATYMRIGLARYRWEFQLCEGETAADFGSVQDVAPLIEPWTASVALTDLELVRVAEYTFRAQISDRWRDRNVFLLGDAAHLTPPFIGQGMGAGLRDAANLSWKLAGVLAGDLPADALDTYEAERLPHARFVIRLAKLVGVAMTRGGRAGNLMRRLLAPRVHQIPGIRARVLDSETALLRRSSLVLRPRVSRSLVGRLCPNAVLADDRRLDDVAGRGFAVVVAAEPTATQASSIRRRGAVTVVAEPGTELGDWLSRGRARAAVVRPDRTVLYATRDLDAAIRALPGFQATAAAAHAGPRATEAS